MSGIRRPFPDLVRACALFGIAVVNVDLFAHLTPGGVLASAWGTPADRTLWWTVAALFVMKSYPLFAMMFGAGIGQQLRSSAAEGTGLTGRHLRRMTGLLALGLFNAAFLFSGDILVFYALLGTLLFLFRNAGPEALWRWSIASFLLQVLVSLIGVRFMWHITTAGDGTELRQFLADSARDTADLTAGFASPDPLVVTAVRFSDWAVMFQPALIFSGPGLFAFILYGLHAHRAGIFDDPVAPRWSRARRLYLPLGSVIAGIGAWLILRAQHEADPAVQLGYLLLFLGSPLSAMGYLGLIAAWSRRPDSPLRTLLVRAGGGSLTAYLLQGLLLSLVFSGYGLGLVGELGAAAYIPIGAAAAVLSLLFVGGWRMRYALGPVEMLLRRWVHLGERRSDDESGRQPPRPRPPGPRPDGDKNDLH